MKRRHAQLPGAIVLSLLLAGCGTSPQMHFYMLNSLPASGEDLERQTATNYSIGLRSITLPLAVDRPQLVLRTSPNKAVIAEEHRWVGSLRSEVQRVTTENLSHLLGDNRVRSFPQISADTADISVFLDIQRFESVLSEGVTIDAFWTVRRDSHLSKSGRLVVKEPIGPASYEEVASAHSRAWMAISREIASPIRAAEAAEASHPLPPPRSLP